MEVQSIISLATFGILAVWLGIISYFLYRSVDRYNKLVTTTDRKTLSSAMEVLLDNQNKAKDQIIDLNARLSQQETKGEFSVQKIGLVRFNPFADTGGEQSFIISLLDEHDSGIVFTSLQGRSGTRWYAKQVKNGKGVQFDLSKEEAESVKKAKSLS